MTSEETAYIAGLVDGEGHIGLHTAQQSNGIRTYYYSDVEVANTNLEVLNWIKEVTGLGIIHKKKLIRKSRQAYAWQLRAYEMLGFLLAIKPYLRIKKRQAELLLEYLEILNNKEPYNRADTVDEYVHKELIYEEISPLNKRGAN